MAAKGEPLNGENLSALYLELAREYYGHDAGICEVKEAYGAEWAYIPHFYYDFYVYQYATSVIASVKLADGIRAEATATPPSTARRDAYLKMLAAGSSRYAFDMLKEAGVDMTTLGAVYGRHARHERDDRCDGGDSRQARAREPRRRSAMKSIRNTTMEPLRVPLGGGKILHLGPGQTGRVADDALRSRGLTRLIDAGAVIVVGEPGGSGEFADGPGAPRESAHGHAPREQGLPLRQPGRLEP
jgi:hypothetical protein